MSSPTLHDPRGYVLPGLANVLANASGAQDHLDMEADIEGEQETMLANADNDKDDEMDSDSDDVDLNIDQEPASSSLPLQWQETMAHAAKGVTDNTHHEYIWLSNACAAFLIDKKLITRKEEFLSLKPLSNSDEMIVAWVMDCCDMIGLDGKPCTDECGSYAHAQKMQASMTYMFGRVLGIGSQPWKQVVSVDGAKHLEGNPSISVKVSTYMVSLRRRKIQASETTMSTCAVTPRIMSDLYDFNHWPENWVISEGITIHQS